MALLTPLWMEAEEGDPDIEYSAAHERAALIGTVFSREGVMDRDAGHLRVTQRAEGPNMSVDVAAGQCAIVGDDVSDQGTYLCMSTTPVNVSVPPPPGSGTRSHLVVAQVKDKLSNGVWTSYEWDIELLEDTGSGTPNVPNSAIPLARVNVAQGAVSVLSSHIADDRTRSVVGTPAITGTLLETGIHSGWGGRDATRPLTFQKNPDGWVTLSGWFRRSGPTRNLTTNTTYGLDADITINNPFANPFVPVEARPSGYRDFIGISSNGYVHYTVRNNGIMSIRFNYNTQVVQNVTWFSLDGCMYRANSF